MPNRVKQNSDVDLLAKVPVNRGSLLKSIENLLKTIESSESAVMIPTLLRDKCEFDAWKLLFVAKILKASILGHSDLVEFYMNHIGHSTNQFKQSNTDQQSTSLSPAMARLASPISTSPSLILDNANQQSSPSQPFPPTTPTPTSSLSSVTITPNSTINRQQSSSNSWATATSGSNQFVSSSSSSNSYNGNGNSNNNGNNGNSTDSSSFQDTLDQLDQSLLAATKPNLMRQAMPPSLLQLTTTNNHINSVAGFTNNNIEQLSNQLTAMQAAFSNSNSSPTSGSPSNGLDGALSISTAVANQQSAPTSVTTATTPTSNTAARDPPHELKTSRSAGCLFRLNSGASSPRTPTTPYPQAETLANGLANGLSGDPSAAVKLLLQIEQLKTSISHVTHLLDSVVELYKKSIDNIALA